MRFLDRIRNQGAPTTPQEADSLALRQLAGRGADLAKPRHVIHYLYFASEEAARAAADAITEGSWRATVEPPTETIAQWCVQADGDRTVGPETVPAFRSWFDGIAAEHGGEYDGWEAAAKP
jgi:Regulator of ribonuclease activity B